MHPGLERLRQDCLDTYRRGRAKPANLTLVKLDDGATMACALGAGYLCHNPSEGVQRVALSRIFLWAREHYGLSEDQASAITHGFDQNTESVYSIDRKRAENKEEFDEALAFGTALLKEVEAEFGTMWRY